MLRTKLLLLCGDKVAKAPGRISHLMQPVAKKYNASDVASSFAHEYPIGIRKTGPRTLIVFLYNVCFRCDMQRPDPSNTAEIPGSSTASTIPLVNELHNYDSGALSGKNNYVDNQPGQKQSKRYQYNFK